MKQAHLIAVNTLIIWGTTLLQMIPPLVMVPFLIRSLGDTGYGTYALIWSLLMAIEQLEVSLQSGGIKYGAAALAQGRIDELNKVLSSTFAFSAILGVLSGLAVGLTGLTAFSGSPGMQVSLLIVGGLLLFLAPTTPFVGIIRAKQRHYINSVASIAAQYAGLLLTVLWFRLVGPSVEALIAILAGTLLISRLAQVPVAYRLVPGLRSGFRHFDRGAFRTIIGFGTMVVLLSICRAANSTGMRWLAGLLVSTGFVAHLAIFLMPGTVLAQIVLAMTITVMPATSAYEASDNRVMLRELFLKSTRYVVLLVSAALLAAGLLVRGVLRLWVGPAYEFLDVYALVNLAGVAVLMSASCAHQMLKGLGALRSIFAAFLAGLVLVPAAVFVAVFLIWGSPYAAISAGLLLGNITAGVLQLRACVRAVQISPGLFFRRAFLEPLAPVAAGLAFAAGATALTGGDSLAWRTAASAAGTAIAFGGFYVFVAGPEERRQLVDFIRMVRARLKEGRAGFRPRREVRMRNMPRLRVTEETIIKSGDPRDMRIEVEKSKRARLIGEASGLFRVPKVLDFDEARGVAAFERVAGLRTLRRAAAWGPEFEALGERIGAALAAIHRDLALPPDMVIPLPEDFRGGGGEVFLHGDFGSKNICLDPATASLVIVDWQCTGVHGGKATFGPRYFDIIWFVNTLLWSPTPRFLTSDPVGPVARRFLEGYYSTAGIPYDANGISSYAGHFFEVKRPSRRLDSRLLRPFLPRCQALTRRFIRSLRKGIFL